MVGGMSVKQSKQPAGGVRSRNITHYYFVSNILTRSAACVAKAADFVFVLFIHCLANLQREYHV